MDAPVLRFGAWRGNLILKRTYPLAIGIFVGTIALDFLTKILAEQHLKLAPIILVDDWVSLRLAYNRGVAFSIMEGLPHWVLGGGAIILLAVVLWNLRGLAARTSGAVALALVAAGGLGNAINRLIDGQVTDMISVWIWPVFNVADTAITIGVLLLFLASRKESPGKKARQEIAAASRPGDVGPEEPTS